MRNKLDMKKHIVLYWPFYCIVGIWFIFASPYFLKGLVPFPSRYLVTFFPPWSATYGMPVKNNAMPDVITQIYPWKKLTIESWKSGQVPLWNPYSFSGTTHAGNFQSAVFSPFNLLFFVLPFVDAWSVLILLQPLLAGLFMFIFLRNLDRSNVASLIASIAFMFCGFMVVWMAYGTLGYAVLWLPLILYAIHNQSKRASWWNLMLLTLGIALSFFSGHFQISTYVIGLSLIFLIFELTHMKLEKGIPLFIFFLFGILLALPQLLPAYNAYIQSVRSTMFSKGEVIPFQYLITLFAPDMFGNPVTRNDWFGHYAEWASFIGVIPLLLSFYSLIGKKSRYVIFFALTAIGSLLFATPTMFNDLLFGAKIPAISTSAASRIIVLVSFALSVLASFGFDMLQHDWKHVSKKKIFGFCISIAFVVLLFWLFFLIKKPLDPEKFIVAKRNLMLPSVMVVGALLLFCVGMMRNTLIRVVAVTTFLLLVSFDLLRFAIKWMPFDPKQYVYPPMPVISALQEKVGISRVIGNFGGELSIPHGILSLEGYDAVYQERYGEFMIAVSRGNIGTPERSVIRLDKHGKYAEDALGLLGVQFALHRLSDGRQGWAYPVWLYPNYRSIYRDEHYELFENINAFPRAFLASSYVVATDKQKIIDQLFGQNLDRKKTIILEQEPMVKPQEGKGSVSITKYSPTDVVFSTETDSSQLLFLSDVYDAGWKAYVDGKRTPLYRADYDFRAVSVPLGTHKVEMQYQPESFVWGVRIALSVLVILIAGSMKELFYAHRHI